jgi:hypothetical protein
MNLDPHAAIGSEIVKLSIATDTITVVHMPRLKYIEERAHSGVLVVSHPSLSACEANLHRFTSSPKLSVYDGEGRGVTPAPHLALQA